MAESAIPDNVSANWYVIHRCNRWGKYVKWRGAVGVSNPVPINPISWWGPMIIDGNVEQLGIVSARDCLPADVNLEEALDTDRCVLALPQHLRDTVFYEHCVVGTKGEKSIALNILPQTFWNRLNAAYPMLLGLFNDVAAGLEPYVPVQAGPGRRPKTI